MYNEKVMDHFHNPRNVGELAHPDGVGEVGNPTCGDIMRIEIEVSEDRIVDIRFKTFGCGAAIATSSMVTEMVKGKTLDEALAISNRAVADELGGLPPLKMHCSNLAADALHRAIEDYRQRQGGGATPTGAPKSVEPDRDACPSCCGKIGRELIEESERAGKRQ